MTLPWLCVLRAKGACFCRKAGAKVRRFLLRANFWGNFFAIFSGTGDLLNEECRMKNEECRAMKYEVRARAGGRAKGRLDREGKGGDDFSEKDRGLSSE